MDCIDLVYVKFEGVFFDDLGCGEEEGVSNVKVLSDSVVNKLFEVFK